MKWQKMVLIASASLVFIGAASAQNAMRQCAEAVADRYNVRRNDVRVNRGDSNRDGFSVYDWQYSRSRSGYCVVDRRGRVSDVGEGRYSGDSGWGNGNGNRPNRPGRPNGGGWNNGGGGGWNNGGNNSVSAPQVKVDTSGRGNYSDGSTSVRITRGWVDTRGNTTVSLSGESNFRVDFYGNITRQNGDREFTMRVTGSSRGNANGTLTFRLNNDRNEVEMINVNGRVDGRNLNGSFSR